MLILIIYYLCMIVYFSSSFLFVFGDDHVTCYTGAELNPGEHVDA